ncbi:MAG: BON domain-containing protein [Acidobacteria bacterium]|nr:BON domain-containing protein [Acidobacteriota bacterium]
MTRKCLTIPWRVLVLGHLCLGTLAVTGSAQAKKDLSGVHARLTEEVRHQLVMLPFYSVFDNLEFRIEGVDTVVLSGQVTRPSIKSDAENVVKKLERVGKVVNSIEVLPVSPNDDSIRRAAYRSIFSRPGLDRYSFMSVPSIHIIVKNGQVTLVGVVANENDKNLAGIAAREVPGTFGITNNLMVEKK